MYRITYTQGNGYYCHCCRDSWEEQADFETREEVVEWLIQAAADQEHTRSGRIKAPFNDRSVDIIEKEIGVDILHEFHIDRTLIVAEVNKRDTAKNKKKLKKEQSERAKNRKKELYQLEKLVKKYPEKVVKLLEKPYRNDI